MGRKGGRKERRKEGGGGEIPTKKRETKESAHLFVANYELINMRFGLRCGSHASENNVLQKARAQVGRRSSSKQHGTVTIGSH